MIRLFQSMIFRLKKDKLFYVMLILFEILPIIFVVHSYITKNTIDQLFHRQMLYISIFISLLVSLFIGVEYSDGALRNKLMVGHRRYKVYLSNLLFLVGIAVGMYAIYMLILVCLGIPLLGVPQLAGFTLFTEIVLQLLAIVAFVSLFTFVSFICSNRIITTILNILLSFGMIFLIIFLIHQFSIPKYLEIYQWNPISETMEYMTILNPRYPSDIERTIILGFLYLIPGSQSFGAMFGISLNSAVVSSVLVTLSIIFSSVGIGLFSIKDLK